MGIDKVQGKAVDTCKMLIATTEQVYSLRRIDVRIPFNGLMLQTSSCFRFHAFAERTECVEFPTFPVKDGDSVITWNSRKLKGKLPPGT